MSFIGGGRLTAAWGGGGVGGLIYGDTYNTMYFSFTGRWVNDGGFISGGVGGGGL